MNTKRQKPRTIEDDYSMSEIGKLRKVIAALRGLVHRIHMNLRLPGEDQEDRQKALETWCQEKEQKRRVDTQ